MERVNEDSGFVPWNRLVDILKSKGRVPDTAATDMFTPEVAGVVELDVEPLVDPEVVVLPPPAARVVLVVVFPLVPVVPGVPPQPRNSNKTNSAMTAKQPMSTSQRNKSRRRCSRRRRSQPTRSILLMSTLLAYLQLEHLAPKRAGAIVREGRPRRLHSVHPQITHYLRIPGMGQQVTHERELLGVE